MRKRYILTESQLRRVIDSQVKNHLNEDILEEGPKEWILAGLLTLSSLAGLSQTKKTIEYDPAKIEQAEKNNVEEDITKENMQRSNHEEI